MDEKNKDLEKVKEEVPEFIAEERSGVKQFFLKYGLIIALIILFVVFGFLSPRFMSTRNVLNLLGQASIIGVLAIGFTFVITTGQFDLSFAALAALCSVLAAMFIGEFIWPIWVGFAATLGVGVLAGAFNGTFIVKYKLPPFLVTVGTMGMFTGIGRTLTGSGMIFPPGIPPQFTKLGRDLVWGTVPPLVLWFGGLAVVAILFLEFTYYGRYLYAVGDSNEAARRVGIKVDKIKFLVYILMGLIAGLAGVLLASLFSGGNPNYGDSYLFPTLISGFLGAIAIKPGKPNIWGTVIAAIFFTVINNGLNMMGFPLFVRQIAQGGIFYFAVVAVSLMSDTGIPGVEISGELG